MIMATCARFVMGYLASGVMFNNMLQLIGPIRPASSLII